MPDANGSFIFSSDTNSDKFDIADISPIASVVFVGLALVPPALVLGALIWFLAWSLGF